jgi:hypothetical protein
VPEAAGKIDPTHGHTLGAGRDFGQVAVPVDRGDLLEYPCPGRCPCGVVGPPQAGGVGGQLVDGEARCVTWSGLLRRQGLRGREQSGSARVASSCGSGYRCPLIEFVSSDLRDAPADVCTHDPCYGGSGYRDTRIFDHLGRVSS